MPDTPSSHIRYVHTIIAAHDGTDARKAQFELAVKDIAVILMDQLVAYPNHDVQVIISRPTTLDQVRAMSLGVDLDPTMVAKR